MRHLVGVGVIASVADAATTWLAMQIALTDGALAFVELNPAMATMIATAGHVPAMTLRVLVGVALFAFLAWAATRSRWGVWPLAIAAVLTSTVVVWNVTILTVALA